MRILTTRTPFYFPIPSGLTSPRSILPGDHDLRLSNDAILAPACLCSLVCGAACQTHETRWRPSLAPPPTTWICSWARLGNLAAPARQYPFVLLPCTDTLSRSAPELGVSMAVLPLQPYFDHNRAHLFLLADNFCFFIFLQPSPAPS